MPQYDPLPDPRVDEYFRVFLARKLNQRLLEDLRRLTSRFAIAFRDAPRSRWSLEVREGVLMEISDNGMPTDCQFTVDGVPTFLDIVAGRLSPQQAFFRRRVNIGGNIELGLRTATALAQFFRKFPFTPGADTHT